MASNHLAIEKEAAWGTWVDPVVSVPVESAAINPANPLMKNDDTGGGRGERPPAPGELTVSGPVAMKLYPVTVPYLISTMFGGKWATAAGTGFRNKLLPDDDVDQDSVSMQKRYSATVAESFRGTKLNTCTISARSKEFAKCATTWVAKDAAVNSDFWWGDPLVASPAVFDAAGAYNLLLPDAFKFYNGVVRLGGSVVETDHELVVTGGTDRCEFDNVSVEMNNNLSNNAFGICLDDQTVQSIDEGKRAIGVKFEPNFAIVGTEFWKAWKNGTPAIFELYFRGPEYDGVAHKRFEMKLTLPYVRYSAAPNPQLDAAYGLKRVAVAGEAAINASVGTDIGLVVQTTDDLTAASWA
ncbi:MAG: phage tail tube protein [Limnohabitans sp.]